MTTNRARLYNCRCWLLNLKEPDIDGTLLGSDGPKSWNNRATLQHRCLRSFKVKQSSHRTRLFSCVSWAEREMDAAATGSDIFSHKTLTSWFLPTPMNLWQITFDPKSRPAPSLTGRTKISGCLVQHIEMQARSQKHLTQSSYLSLQMFPSNQCWVLCIVTWFNWTQSLTIDIAGLVLTNIRPHLDNWFGSNCRTVYY